MICPKCKKDIPRGKFCDSCGAELEIPAKATMTTVSERVETKSKLLFGKYELVTEIGRGGMGIVYEAIDTTLDRKVAIKKMREELKINLREKKRFIKEAKTVARLHHPNIVDIYQIFEEEGDIYLEFEYVDGKSIEQLLDEREKLSLKTTLNIVCPVCKALSYAHENNVVHRDLKPSNIMVTGQKYVKVMDFGIARAAKDTISRVSSRDTSGALAYMAPEQHLGESNKTADIYSLGVTMYEMLTGQLPFSGPDFLVQKERMIYCLPSEITPDLPKQIDEIISKCLQADKKKRFTSIIEFQQQLERVEI